MAPRIISQFPSISSLYLNSTLVAVPASATRMQPSSALNSRVSVLRANITTLSVDAIVNAANESLLGGGGVDGAIHRAAGPGLVDECSRLDGCPTGEARITGAYELPARHVIHTVGPVYNRRSPEQSRRLLRSCYTETLKLAAKEGVRTLAFSGISTGVYGYPSQDAAEVACETVRQFLEEEDEGKEIDKVVFVTFENKDMEAYQDVLP